METPSPDAGNGETIARAFRAGLDTLPGPVFAVLDGGHFDDLEDELAEAGISSRSLFLKGSDDEMRRDGPWLVALKDKNTRTHIEELALEKPCAVFWSCPEGEQALWRHLRSINEILIPDDRIPGNDGKSGAPVQYERVLFRHWDPNILGGFLPLLTTEQFTRIFGPATAIFMNATDYGGLKRAARPRNLSVAATGPLRIEPEQFENFKQAVTNRSTAAIADYLRATAPEVVDDLDDVELHRQITKARKSGNGLGLYTDDELGDWAFLYLASDGDVLKDTKLVEYIKSGAGGDSSDLKKSPGKRLVDAIEFAAEI